MRVLIVGLISLLSTSFCANAASPFFYVGASAQKQNVKLPDFTNEGVDIESYINIDYQTDTEGSPFRIFGGYQFNNFFAAEVGYTDYLTRSFTLVSNDVPGRVNLSGSSESQSLDAKAILSIPVTKDFSAKVTLGGAFWSSDTDKLGGSFRIPTVESTSDNGISIVYGIGASYAINKRVAIVFDWEKRSINSSSVDSVGLGVAISL